MIEERVKILNKLKKKMVRKSRMEKVGNIFGKAFFYGLAIPLSIVFILVPLYVIGVLV